MFAPVEVYNDMRSDLVLRGVVRTLPDTFPPTKNHRERYFSSPTLASTSHALTFGDVKAEKEKRRQPYRGRARSITVVACYSPGIVGRLSTVEECCWGVE